VIPIGDENPTFRTPVVTIGLILVMLAIWVFVQGAGMSEETLVRTVCNLGLVPAELTHLQPVGTAVPLAKNWVCVVDNNLINWATPLTSMFLHGSWGHILSNALFLWVFGNNVEDVMGRGRFLFFYLLCGLVAAATHVMIDPSAPVPTVGASGAISGALGAYLLLYPRVRVRMFFPPIFLLRIPAWLVLIWWFIIQFLTGLPQLLAPAPEISGGVAVWAHIGGFAAGMLLSRVFENPFLIAQHRAVLRARAAADI
jgi:membrane associated rhomboid family serine protease